MKILLILFWVITKLFFGGGGGMGGDHLYLCVLGSFVKCTEWKYLSGALNFKYFWGMPVIPDIFFGGRRGEGVNSRCWVQA